MGGACRAFAWSTWLCSRASDGFACSRSLSGHWPSPEQRPPTLPSGGLARDAQTPRTRFPSARRRKRPILRPQLTVSMCPLGSDVRPAQRICPPHRTTPPRQFGERIRRCSHTQTQGNEPFARGCRGLLARVLFAACVRACVRAQTLTAISPRGRSPFCDGRAGAGPILANRHRSWPVGYVDDRQDSKSHPRLALAGSASSFQG